MNLHPWLAGMVLAMATVVVLAVAALPADEPAAKKSRVLKLFADEFVNLKPGTFRMGSAEADAPAAEKPVV